MTLGSLPWPLPHLDNAASPSLWLRTVTFLWSLCLAVTKTYVKGPLRDLMDSDLRGRQSSSEEIKHCGVGRCYLVAGLWERRHEGGRKKGESGWVFLKLGTCPYMKNLTELFPEFTLKRTNHVELDNDICPYCRVYLWLNTTFLSILSISSLNKSYQNQDRVLSYQIYSICQPPSFLISLYPFPKSGELYETDFSNTVSQKSNRSQKITFQRSYDPMSLRNTLNNVSVLHAQQYPKG